MHQPSTVSAVGVERHALRPGFQTRFHRVTFELEAEGVPSTTFDIWVHPAYPDAELLKVARRFLARRLADLAEAAEAGSMAEREVEKLWDRVKPEAIT